MYIYIYIYYYYYYYYKRFVMCSKSQLMKANLRHGKVAVNKRLAKVLRL